MKGFLYRDMRLSLRYWGIQFGFVILYVVLTLFGLLNLNFLLVILPIYLSAYPLRAIGYELNDGWAAFAVCTPNGVKRMVQGKYRTNLLIVGAVWIFNLLLSILFDVLGRQTFAISLHVSILGAGMAILYCAICLPLVCCFGYRDGVILTILVVSIGIFLVYKIVMSGLRGGGYDLQRLNLLALIPVAAIILFHPSYRASVSACERREF